MIKKIQEENTLNTTKLQRAKKQLEQKKSDLQQIKDLDQKANSM